VPTSGGVLLGEDGVASTDPVGRRLCSFLPQRVVFPESLTGHEVVEFFRELRGAVPARTGEVLRFASLNGAADRPVHTYSGGMVQRLGLAVATLPDAPLLLLDEPTASLDPDGLSAFYALIQQRRRDGKTLLFTSHQLGDAEHLADRIAIVVEGHLAGVFGERELARHLADRGTMVVGTDRPGDATLLARVREVAPGATWTGQDLLVEGPPELRPAVLEAVRSAGAMVTRLTVQEARLDGFYRELVKERT
jgi:Cu-processing system ATP-binding protein